IVVNSYQRPPPHVRATIEDISEPGTSATIEYRSDKMLLLTWHDSSTPAKDSVCDSVTPRSMPQHDSSTPGKDSVCESVTPRCMPHGMLTPPTDEFVITYTQLSSVQGVDKQDHVLPTIQSQFSDINLSFVSQQPTASQVIEDVMRQLSFEETELDGEAGFGDVAGSGIDSSGLSHDESFRVDDLDLNLNIIETQTKLHVLEVLVFEEADVGRTEVPVSEEADVGRTEVPVSEEADVGRTEEHVVEQVIVEEVVDGSFEEDVEHGNGQEAVEAPSDEQVDYDVEKVESSEDTVEDVDVVNLDGFDSDTCNDNETSNYKRRRLDELRREMEGVMNASGQ
ncbi:hypothetical protein Tco_1559687, partial [Tanacetum coccineum]